jgi:hypothetical protein
MRENMRAKKQRPNPNGVENDWLREFERWLRCADKRRMGSVFVAPGYDRSNCTTMLDLARIGVDALV